MKRPIVILMLVAFIVTATGCTYIKRHDSSSDSGRDKPVASKKVRKLIKDLGSSNLNEIGKASFELLELGDEAVPSLIYALQDDSGMRRMNAANTLREMGNIGVQYVPQLLSVTGTPGGLSYVPHILEGMGDEVFPVLKELLSDEDPEIRLAVLRCLERGFRNHPTQVQAFVPDVICAMEDPNSRVRVAAVSALVAIDSDSQEVINNLIDLLGTDDEEMGRHLRYKFRNLGPRTIPFLEEALIDENPTVRARAAFALNEMHYDDKSVIIPVYIETLKHPSESIRGEAIRGVRDFGHDAKDAIPSIIEIMNNDENYIFRRNAALCIYDLGTPVDQAMPLLINKFTDSDQYVYKEGAMYSMANYGIEAIPYLVDAMGNEDERIRRGVVKTLQTIGEDAKGSVPVLIKALQDTDFQVRGAAIYALGAIHDDSSEVVLAIADCLSDEQHHVRYAAVVALRQFGPAAKEAVPQLIQALDDESLEIRKQAVQALGSIGPDAKEALPKIREVDLGQRPKKYKHPCYDDPEEIRKDAIARIEGTWEEEE